jgi:hypothetical protein
VADLSRAVGDLAEYLEEPGRFPESTRRLALEATRDANAVLQERNDLVIAALVAQIRSTTVNILRGPAWTTKRRSPRSRLRLPARPKSLPTPRGAPILLRSRNSGRHGRAVRHQQSHLPVLRLLKVAGIRETRKETRERKRPNS